MKPKLILLGLVIWIVATLALRAGGQRILSDRHWLHVLLLFTTSFVVVAILVRRVCTRARLAPEQWPAGAVSLLLPTLLLDPFSSAFFPVVFPNMAPENAGVFGGWMIICCAGGLLGAVIHRSYPPVRQLNESAQSS
jgi:Family of unknown function (DUF5367)